MPTSFFPILSHPWWLLTFLVFLAWVPASRAHWLVSCFLIKLTRDVFINLLLKHCIHLCSAFAEHQPFLTALALMKSMLYIVNHSPIFLQTPSFYFYSEKNKLNLELSKPNERLWPTLEFTSVTGVHSSAISS